MTATPNNQPIKFLLFSASMRAGSLNSMLINLASKSIEKIGAVADIAQMRDFDCPSYNNEEEHQKHIPPGAEAFRNRLLETDAFIIASPEYNASMPGILKNAIDWVSRFRPQPFNERHCLLMSASPSMAGGNKGLWSLRVPLEHLGSRVFPDMFSLAMAHQAFHPDGSLVNQTLAQRFDNNILAFKELVEAAKHYPCMKKAWVEFLGEKPDPVTERVE